jgi:hypothetical protein
MCVVDVCALFPCKQYTISVRQAAGSYNTGVGIAVGAVALIDSSSVVTPAFCSHATTTITHTAGSRTVNRVMAGGTVALIDSCNIVTLDLCDHATTTILTAGSLCMAGWNEAGKE